jgi:hypothetical protein
MDAQPQAGERLVHVVAVGHGLEQVATERIEQVDLAAMRGLEHLQGAMALAARQRSTPQRLESAPVRLVRDLEATRILVGIHAAFAAALHAGVSADGHDPALLAAEEPTGQREIDQRFHVVDAEAMLGEPHAVDEHRALRAPDFFGEAPHVVTGETAVGFEPLPCVP